MSFLRLGSCLSGNAQNAATAIFNFQRFFFLFYFITKRRAWRLNINWKVQSSGSSNFAAPSCGKFTRERWGRAQLSSNAHISVYDHVLPLSLSLTLTLTDALCRFRSCSLILLLGCVCSRSQMEPFVNNEATTTTTTTAMWAGQNSAWKTCWTGLSFYARRLL